MIDNFIHIHKNEIQITFKSNFADFLRLKFSTHKKAAGLTSGFYVQY